MNTYYKTESQRIKIAEKIIDYLIDDPSFMNPGRRNDDTVDLMICCKILGRNAIDEAYRSENFKGSEDNINAFLIKKDKVSLYLNTWGPESCRSLALDYLVREYKDIEEEVLAHEKGEHDELPA